MTSYLQGVCSITMETDTGIEDPSCYFGVSNIWAMPEISEKSWGFMDKKHFS